MKKIVSFIICVSFLFVSSVMAKTITVNYPDDQTTGTVYIKGSTMDFHDTIYDETLTPVTVTIDGVTYQALTLDYFNTPIQSGNHEVTFSCPSTFVNNEYVDSTKSLGYALYNLNANWDETRDFAYVQVMFWDTLYDYQPDQNQHIDRNFMCWDVIDYNFDDVTNAVKEYQTPYQNFLLNSMSNQTFTTVGLFEKFTVISFNESDDYRHLIIKGTLANDGETSVECEPIILEVEVPVEKIVYVDREVKVEVPVEKIVYVEMPIIRTLTQTVEVKVPVEKIVYVDKIVEVPVEKIVYVEKIVEVPVEKIVYVEKKKQKKSKKILTKKKKHVHDINDPKCSWYKKEYKANNGHGNDKDHNDDSNPGKSNRIDDDTDDDGSHRCYKISKR